MKLTESEADFARWMEEVDLEEVNLLPAQPKKPAHDAYGQPAAPASNALKGDGKPVQLPARDTGWKAD